MRGRGVEVSKTLSCLCFGIVEVPNVKAISDINQNIVFNGEGF